LRHITQEDGALLIFDEVMTGFRVAYGGVQELKGIKADLTTLGKVIGGGLPIGAYGGRKDIMSMVAPEGPVYQAGTLSGNPVAVASGLKTLEIIARPGAFARLSEITRQLADGLRKVASKHGIPFYSDSEGGMFGFFFHKGPVHSLEEAKQGDGARFKAFFWGMLDEGIYLAPSAYEAGFVSMAHTPLDIDATLAAADRVLAKLS
jgi:glutamate-1-semialdehyde 2,1-aminomutase